MRALGNPSLDVAVNQPFLLDLEAALLLEAGDPARDLPSTLKAGVPLGVEEIIPNNCDVWPAARSRELQEVPPLVPAERNYASFVEHEAVVRQSYQEDVRCKTVWGR